MLNRLKNLLHPMRMLAGVALLSVGVSAGAALNITGTETQWRNSIFQVGILRISRETAITAFSGGGQTGAYPLTAGLSRIATVAAGNDSVLLPPCVDGKIMIVINAAASNSANVYPSSGDAINALSANSAFALAANKTAIFACAIDGTWFSNLTA